MVCVIVEDCIDKVDNWFELVLFVSYCVCQILQGVGIMIDCDNDKNLVVVFCEIVDEMLFLEDLKEDFIYLLQKYVEVDEFEFDLVLLVGSVVVGNDLEEEDFFDMFIFDCMLEEELLVGIEGFVLLEKSDDY